MAFLRLQEDKANRNISHCYGELGLQSSCSNVLRGIY